MLALLFNMTYNDLATEFTKDIQRMREWNKKIALAEKALGVDLWEGTIGEMMDELFHYMIEPYAVLAQHGILANDEDPDQVYEILWNLILESEDDAIGDIHDFYIRFLKGAAYD